MNRDQAHKAFEARGRYEFINGYGHFCIPKHQMWRCVDKIYDHFEQRIKEYEFEMKCYRQCEKQLALCETALNDYN